MLTGVEPVLPVAPVTGVELVLPVVGDEPVLPVPVGELIASEFTCARTIPRPHPNDKRMSNKTARTTAATPNLPADL